LVGSQKNQSKPFSKHKYQQVRSSIVYTILFLSFLNLAPDSNPKYKKKTKTKLKLGIFKKQKLN